MDSKRIKKYFLYALGEVVLIFIGITLAIWFNNRKEEQTSLSTEASILTQMHENLSSDIEFFNWQISASQRACNNDSMLINVPNETLPLSVLLNGFKRINISVESLNASSYEELNSHNNKGLIKDQKIRNLIEDYYGEFNLRLHSWAKYDLEQTLEAEKHFKFNDFFEIIPLNEISSDDTLSMKLESVEFLNSPKSRNLIRHNLGVKKSCLDIMSQARSAAIELRGRIRTELDLGDE